MALLITDYINIDRAYQQFKAMAMAFRKKEMDWANYVPPPPTYGPPRPPSPIHIARSREYLLPDGARLMVDADGNYEIEDQDAKVTYKANRLREFSPHLNASDMVAGFVRYCGQLKVRQDEVLQLPLELFINWLVVEAAERDQDRLPPDVLRLEDRSDLKEVVKPRCLQCKRFIPRVHVQHRFLFCDPSHAGRWLERRKELVK